jgi:hypothetical protein
MDVSKGAVVEERIASVFGCVMTKSQGKGEDGFHTRAECMFVCVCVGVCL